MGTVTESATDALVYAHQLVNLGVPVFTCRLDAEGEPLPPDRWQKTKPSHDAVDRWRPGQGLCAVTGHMFDVLDIDPRNGGQFSIKRMSDELGDDGPDVFWRVKTPSGGLHLWVAPLGMRGHNGFMPGLDYKGGDAEGEGRGFVFLPPTVRPSKEDGVSRAYVSTKDIESADGEPPCEPLRDYINNCLASRASQNGHGGGRVDSDDLAQACIDAPEGGQREALLRYTHELERMGTSRSNTIRLLLSVVEDMPVYDKRKPWKEKDLRGLLHAPGQVVPDALPGEIPAGLRPLTSGLVRSVADLDDVIVSWLWQGYIAFREFTILDGEKAVGKTLVLFDIAARATLGRAMPGQAEAICGPQRVMVFGDEGHIESVTKPRLRAAGADLKYVFIPNIKVPKRRDKAVDWNLALPGGAQLMASMIAEAGATLAVFDPITDFLDESIQTHNDASVRRALRPLAIELAKVGCGGFGIRHMNKDTTQNAKYRGSGSSAFQNRARVHLVAREIPVNMRPGVEGKYAIAMVDSNMAVKKEGALTYDIVDSDVPMDDLGNMVGKVKWHDYYDIDVLSADKRSHGPAPSEDRVSASELLAEMFSEQDTWPRKEVEKRLKDAGVSLTHVTLNKVKAELGIRAEREHRRGSVGISAWVWTIKKASVKD